MARVRGVAGFLAFHLPFYYGWVVVAVGFTTLGIGYTARAVFSLLFPPILDEFGWQRADTAAVFSVGFASAALYMPLMGYWLDRFGPGIVLPVGAVMVSAGFILTTVSTEVWHFILSLGALVVGASTLLAYNAHFVFVPNWFETRRGLALGIVSSGAGVISILALPLLLPVLPNSGRRRAKRRWRPRPGDPPCREECRSHGSSRRPRRRSPSRARLRRRSSRSSWRWCSGGRQRSPSASSGGSKIFKLSSGFAACLRRFSIGPSTETRPHR